MNGEMTKRLNDRAAQYYHKHGKPPKRLSVTPVTLAALKMEATSGGMVNLGNRSRTVYFCGIPIRVRNYKRERAARKPAGVDWETIENKGWFD